MKCHSLDGATLLLRAEATSGGLAPPDHRPWAGGPRCPPPLGPPLSLVIE